ncbi:MAG: helix-turn-helix transcriptional regulator [Niabella sp.]
MVVLFNSYLNNGFYFIFRMISKKKAKSSGEDFDLFLIELGKKLKSYREAAGYTSYEHFAYDKNIGRAQYGKYERGTEDMRLSSLFKLLDAVGVTWEEFFKEIKR